MELSTKKYPEIGVKAYITIHEQNNVEIKKLIKRYPRQCFDWYINSHDHFVTFFFNNLNILPTTFNGITKKDLIKIFEDCKVELGQNLYDKENEMFEFIINGYYVNDYNEQSYTFSVIAHTEKQAKFLLSRKLNTPLAVSLQQGYYFRHIYNKDIFVIQNISSERIEEIRTLEVIQL